MTFKSSLQILVSSITVLEDNRFAEMKTLSDASQSNSLGCMAEFFEKESEKKMTGKIVRIGSDSILVDLTPNVETVAE